MERINCSINYIIKKADGLFIFAPLFGWKKEYLHQITSYICNDSAIYICISFYHNILT